MKKENTTLFIQLSPLDKVQAIKEWVNLNGSLYCNEYKEYKKTAGIYYDSWEYWIWIKATEALMK